MKPVVLLAEDEKSIRDIVKLNLEIEGFEVVIAEDGRKALEIFNTLRKRISIVLLDIMMPILNGLEVCKTIKSLEPELPIMMITAKGEGEDRVTGLKTGADDYLVKPFNLEELIIRVHNLNKRNSKTEQADFFEFSENRIDFINWTYSGVNGVNGNLTKREISLLKLLIEKRNTVVSRDEILQNVWDKTENPSARTIDNMILFFRKIFEKDPKTPEIFLSIRGVGYRFKTE